ncbi:MAG: zinc-ribbon domain-containing protein [Lachnospiraceae bacterium]|nr:zinc-ribbon domain-containing protein [Lachnospiraceae bacterium]
MNIVLKSVGTNKVQVIKALREVTSFGLAEAKDIVDRVEVGNEYIITDIQETDAQAIIEKFTQIGATVMVDEDKIHNLTEDVNQMDSVMVCNNCGTKLENGAKFCSKCGASVEVQNTIKDEVNNSSDESDKEGKGEKVFNKLFDRLGEFLEWFIELHEKLFKKNKVVTIALIVAEAVLILWLLFKTWEILIGILIIAGIVLPFIMKHDFTDKDRQNSKEIIIGFAKIMAGVIIVVIIALNWNSISSIWNPGAVVRNAYFTSYSDEITIGEAFENVFTDCKWSKYTYNGNKYVRFTGKFKEDNGKASTYQFNFLVLGDSATIDSIYIDGVDVSGMETVLLVGIYNRNGVSW